MQGVEEVLKQGKFKTTSEALRNELLPETLRGFLIEQSMTIAFTHTLASVLPADAEAHVEFSVRAQDFLANLGLDPAVLGGNNPDLDWAIRVRLQSGVEFFLWAQVKSNERSYGRLGQDLIRSWESTEAAKSAVELGLQIPVITLAVPIQINGAQWRGNAINTLTMRSVLPEFDFSFLFAQTQPTYDPRFP